MYIWVPSDNVNCQWDSLTCESMSI